MAAEGMVRSRGLCLGLIVNAEPIKANTSAEDIRVQGPEFQLMYKSIVVKQ